MSRDMVVLVLPFLQQYHSDYGDYWRVSPLGIKRLFEENGFELLYLSFNSHRMSSVYTFSMATCRPKAWIDLIPRQFSCVDPEASGSEPFIGQRAIPNTLYRIVRRMKKLI